MWQDFLAEPYEHPFGKRFELFITVDLPQWEHGDPGR
jgi:hypothetical protein